MEPDELTWSEVYLPIIFLAGGLVAGLVIDHIILTRLRKMAAKTSWGGVQVIIGSLHFMPVLWGVALGGYLATLYADLDGTVLSIIRKSLLVVVVLSVTWVLARIVSGLIKMASYKEEGLLPSTSIFANLAALSILVIGVLVLLQTLGVSITPLLTALGVGGLAVALALQDTLSNLFAGFHILASKTVKPGDYVQLDSGEEGYVVDVTWRNTNLRELPNNRIVIPNAKLASSIVRNFNYPELEMSVLIDVGVDYTSDLGKVEEVTLEVANGVVNEIHGGSPDFEPLVRYNGFGDSSIDFTVIFRVNEFMDQYLVRHEFIKRLHHRFDEEGIVIPFPIRTVHMAGANAQPSPAG